MSMFAEFDAETRYQIRRLWSFIRGDWWLTRFGQWVCERTYHAPGVIWFNAGGAEPDMRCRRCWKDLA